ncbi:CDC48 family AAA ATPase [Halobacteriaceae archaeon GCM10025711]
MTDQDDAVELVVREAAARDAGRGIVRLPQAVQRRLGVLSGETVVIEGDRTTVAKIWPGDRDLRDGELRIDGQTRANAGARVGDPVRVRKASVEQAERVELTPAGPTPGDTESLAEAAKRSLLDRPVSTGERVRVDALGTAGEFEVTATTPRGPVVVTERTVVEVPASKRDRTPERRVGVTYEDIGGLDEELELVRELVELPVSEPGLFRRLGIEPPAGVLLHGPPGTGKTLIAKAVANEADAHFISISGPEIVSKYKGESEERLREVFQEARDEAPSIVFFDEIDSVAGRREDDADMESRVVAQLLSLMDGLETRGEVVVIGATNRVDAIDPALRRPGRFDREIEVGVPGVEGRHEVLEIHTRGMPLADDVDLDAIAERTYGFVGADIQALATEAAMHALRRVRDGEVDAEDVRVTRADFERALGSVEPSAMREFVAELPATSFDDIGGLDEAKATLREAIEWPLSYRNLFEATATTPPTGILLYGPPGTGKTMLARAIAHESGVNVIHVAGPELVDKYVGESEKAVREVFDRARQTAPTIVFFDEIDAIAARRGDGSHEVAERVVSQLLTELDGVQGNPNLVVLAATNRREAIDPALLRPGRLEAHVEVPVPDEEGRRAVLRVHTEGKPLADDVDLDGLAADLQGYSGADIASLVRQASMLAIREAAAEQGVEMANERADEIRIRADHFQAARERVGPRQSQ